MKKTILIATALVLAAGIVSAAEIVAVTAAASNTSHRPEFTARSAHPDTGLAGGGSMALKGDSEGTILKSLTIEGEDRVSVRFERPQIVVDLPLRQAPGLGWKNSWEKADFFRPMVARTAQEQSPFLARPWLVRFAQGNVVVFHPEAPDAAQWRLMIADSRGKPAAAFAGENRPPKNLAWDGRRTDGTCAWPGLTYSTVIETTDKAGNPRTMWGEGFDLPSYRLETENGTTLVFSGAELPNNRRPDPAAIAAGDRLLVEAAGWLNQIEDPSGAIEIRTIARTSVQAHRLAQRVADELTGRVIGDAARIHRRAEVAEDAPDDGTILISAR